MRTAVEEQVNGAVNDKAAAIKDQVDAFNAAVQEAVQARIAAIQEAVQDKLQQTADAVSAILSGGLRGKIGSKGKADP